MASPRLEIVLQIVAAWRSHDIDTVVGHLADDVEWHYHVGSRPIIGVVGVRKTLDRLAGHQLDVAWQIVRAAEGEDAVMVEGTDYYRTPAGVRVRVPYMGVFQFGDPESNRVTAWRDYVDLALMQSAEAAEPQDPWITSLVERPGLL
ncbi:MAG: nuclear transport factor 2 family protein [Actinomycetota bacterium]|nr:nuclear transport factor 2 family protein [Actinomycetota bacterium]